jgi:hypothetical protein
MSIKENSMAKKAGNKKKAPKKNMEPLVTGGRPKNKKKKGGKK